MIFFWLANAPALIKIAIFFGVWVSLWMPMAALIAIAVKWYPPQPLNETKKLALLVPLYLIVPFLLGQISQAENQSFSDYGLAWQPELGKSILWGLGGGLVSLICLFSLQFALGWLQWGQKPVQEVQKLALSQGLLTQNFSPAKLLALFWQKGSIFFPILLIALWISGTEELVFRGFLQALLQQDYSGFVAATIASLIFALTHLIWDVEKTWPQLPGLWLMGMVLTWACVCNGGGLGLAIGLHGGWIWGLTSLDTLGGVTPTQRVPEWVTGLAAKPLAGVLGIVMLLLVAILLAIVYDQSGLWLIGG